jgi:predicted PurR-regulated permease PerM
MFGLVGAIVAIPIAGCIKVLLEEYGDNLPFNDDSKTSPKPEPKVQKIIAEK